MFQSILKIQSFFLKRERLTVQTVYINILFKLIYCFAKRPIIIRIKNNKQKLKQQLIEATNIDKCRAIVTALVTRQQECVHKYIHTNITNI